MRHLTRPGRSQNAAAGGMPPPRCSVCAQATEHVDAVARPGGPGLTCGLCGATIALPSSDAAPCQACGEPILCAADGVKLCDGRIVHAVCGADRR